MNISTRKSTRIYIIENIVDIADDQLKELYDKFLEILQDEDDNKNIGRQQMLSYIEGKVKYIDDNNLLEIKSIIMKFLASENEYDKKVEIALELANKILEADKKEKIDELEKFTNINRDMFMNDDVKKAIDEMKEKIFNNGFKKYDCMLYQKTIKYPHLSIFKGVLKQINHVLKPIHKNKIKDGSKEGSKRENKDGCKNTFTTYSIQKKI